LILISLVSCDASGSDTHPLEHRSEAVPTKDNGCWRNIPISLKIPLCRSKRSIKRDVKKKVLPRPEARFLSRDPAHWSFTSLEKFGLLSILVSFSADGDAVVEFKRAASELLLPRQPWFYPRLVAYGYFWLSERA